MKSSEPVNSEEWGLLPKLSKHHGGRIFVCSTPRQGKGFMSNLWENEQKRKLLSGILEGPKGHSTPLMVAGVDMASGESREKWMAMNIAMGGQPTVTIDTADGLKTFPVQNVTWTHSLPPLLATDWLVARKKINEWFRESLAALYGPQEEENVNYLFEVYAINLESQAMIRKDPIICKDTIRATAIMVLRLGLPEEELDKIKFHVERICTVPEYDGD